MRLAEEMGARRQCASGSPDRDRKLTRAPVSRMTSTAAVDRKSPDVGSAAIPSGRRATCVGGARRHVVPLSLTTRSVPAWSPPELPTTESNRTPSGASCGRGRRRGSRCAMEGANLIPLRGRVYADLHAFADKAMGRVRRCSSLVGRAELVLPMWQRLERAWGPARDVRADQPLLALRAAPARSIDSAVRRVRMDELDAYLVAAVDMFIGEVGVDPRLGDGGRTYRRRVAGLIAAGRAWARFERGKVVFKAEVGSESPAVGQIQGVWVHPERRGHGLGAAGTAAVAAAVVAVGAASRACTSTATTRSRVRCTRISASPRSGRSRPFCWTDPPRLS